MQSSRALYRSARALRAVRPATAQPLFRPFSAYASRLAEDKEKAPVDNKKDFDNLNQRGHPNVEQHRKNETESPLNPHLTNSTSTMANDMPSVGENAPPPDMLGKVAGAEKFEPVDARKGNTEKMTGGTMSEGSSGKRGYATMAENREKAAEQGDEELGVGELEGASFRVEPLRRTGEDANTMRARLLYQSRKRGTLESELLMSTFADTYLPTMTPAQLQQYDLFLDENDWDIYYWATQEPTPTSVETAEGSRGEIASKNAMGKDTWKRQPASGEWAQTVGTFKPAYRPVPKRWAGSEILEMLREHVRTRSAGGESGSGDGRDGKGLGMMPEIRNFDQH